MINPRGADAAEQWQQPHRHVNRCVLKREIEENMYTIDWAISPPVTNDDLNALFAVAWHNHQYSDFQQVLRHSLLYICAFHHQQLIGYVNVAWDGGRHAFLLDTTVHSQFQRQGIGQQLVQTAIAKAKQRGIEWMHVDYEPHLRSFYAQCGFGHTEAGVINLRQAGS
jgi:GNAT superfamily N-acetyltransferase